MTMCYKSIFLYCNTGTIRVQPVYNTPNIINIILYYIYYINIKIKVIILIKNIFLAGYTLYIPTASQLKTEKGCTTWKKVLSI